jgi:hypothetical protein
MLHKGDKQRAGKNGRFKKFGSPQNTGFRNILMLISAAMN